MKLKELKELCAALEPITATDADINFIFVDKNNSKIPADIVGIETSNPSAQFVDLFFLATNAS